MVKIEDAVDGVLNAMRSRGCVQHSLKEIKWSIYTPIIHADNETVIRQLYGLM